MKGSRFSQEQILNGAARARSRRAAVADLCRRHGISEQTRYRWKQKYGGLAGSELRRLKGLEKENACLKRLVAEQALDNQMLKDLLRKNSQSLQLDGKRYATYGSASPSRSIVRAGWWASSGQLCGIRGRPGTALRCASGCGSWRGSGGSA
jgi:putative transposase